MQSIPALVMLLTHLGAARGEDPATLPTSATSPASEEGVAEEVPNPLSEQSETTGFEDFEVDDWDADFEEKALDPVEIQDFSIPDSPLSSAPDWSFLSPSRLSFKHELGMKIYEPRRVLLNRSSIRPEYSKLLFGNLFLQLDGKAIAFWRYDHRSETQMRWINPQRLRSSVSVETRFADAYLQTSYGGTSLKAGIQTMAFGESQSAVVTDEISPRSYTELFNFNLDELRIGQPIVSLSQFTPLGTFGTFLVPFPAFNEYPERGSAFYFNPLDGMAVKDVETEHEGLEDVLGHMEFGLSWRKTAGKSDLAVVAVSLLENDYNYRLDDSGILLKAKSQYWMYGANLTHSIPKFILRGEVAVKAEKTFQTADLQITRRPMLDASFAVDYSPEASITAGIEGAVNHVRDWTGEILSIPQNSYSSMLSLSKLLLHDNLSMNAFGIYTVPYPSFVALLATSYRWNDKWILEASFAYPVSRDRQSQLHIYRDQKQVLLSALLQF